MTECHAPRPQHTEPMAKAGVEVLIPLEHRPEMISLCIGRINPPFGGVGSPISQAE